MQALQIKRSWPRRSPYHDEAAAYAKPRPQLVAYIVDEYGPEAAVERWGYLSVKTIQLLASEGRRLGAHK